MLDPFGGAGTTGLVADRLQRLPAAVDPEGWDLDVLGATLRQSSPRLAYLIPDFQNPSGAKIGRAHV